MEKIHRLEDLRVLPVGPAVQKMEQDHAFPFVVFSDQTEPTAMAKAVSGMSGLFCLRHVEKINCFFGDQVVGQVLSPDYYRYLSLIKLMIDQKFDFIPEVPEKYDMETFDVLLLGAWEFIYCSPDRNWPTEDLVKFVTSESFKTVAAPKCIFPVAANQYSVQQLVAKGYKNLHLLGNKDIIVSVIQKIKELNGFLDANLMIDIDREEEILPALALGVKKLNISSLLQGTDESDGELTVDSMMLMRDGSRIPYRGSAYDVLSRLKERLTKNMCSLGAETIEDLIDAPLSYVQGHKPWTKN